MIDVVTVQTKGMKVVSSVSFSIRIMTREPVESGRKKVFGKKWVKVENGCEWVYPLPPVLTLNPLPPALDLEHLLPVECCCKGGCNKHKSCPGQRNPPASASLWR